MRSTVVSVVVAMAAVLVGAACSRGPTGAIDGVTQYQVCGGAVPPDGRDPCSPPEPRSGTVTVRRGDTVVATARSGQDGRFRLVLPTGEYTARLALDPGAPYVDCPPVAVVVPAAGPVTLTCRLLAP